MTFNLYPPPKRFRQHKSSLSLRNRCWIVLKPEVSDRLRLAAIRFANEIAREASITFATPPPDEILVSLHSTGKSPGDESHEIICSQDGIHIYAHSDAGLFYGLATMKQLLAQADTQLPFFRIEDTPDFSDRGVMLDISRCKVPTMDTLFDQIDRLADLKYNQLQLYTEHTFAFASHPIVWANASPLTPRDIVRLQNYCKDRFIELVPNLNSFGHFERWLRHPEYRSYAECPDGFEHPLTGTRVPHGSTLKPAPQSLKLLESLYDEFLPLFSADQFNVGGDEPWELGQGWSKKKCEARGRIAVYVEFLGKIQALAKARGRRMMFWSDIVLKEPGCLKHLSPEVTVLNWGYEANHPFKKECEILGDAGLAFYVCPGTSAWNSLTGRTGNVLSNLSSAARNGIRSGARGYLVTDWGDHGHHQYPPISYQGFVMGACHAWNHRGSGKLDPADGISRLYFQDKTGAAGKVIVQLGNVHELTNARVRNGTLFNRLLFWNMEHEPHAATEVTSRELTDCLDALAELEDSVSQALEQPLPRAELHNGIRMARHGIHRLQYFRSEAHDKAKLRAELMTIIGHHEDLWLARNRPGGLRESVDHLERSLSSL